MASNETQELIIQAIEYYIEKCLCPGDKRPSIDVMRVIIKYDDIKKGLQKTVDA